MEARKVERRDDERRGPSFYRGELPKKFNKGDNTLKSSFEFDKLSPQSRIVRRGRGV